MSTSTVIVASSSESGKRIACVACAHSKSRCDKMEPKCSRCVEKGIECTARHSSVPRSRRASPGGSDRQALDRVAVRAQARVQQTQSKVQKRVQRRTKVAEQIATSMFSSISATPLGMRRMTDNPFVHFSADTDNSGFWIQHLANLPSLPPTPESMVSSPLSAYSPTGMPMTPRSSIGSTMSATLLDTPSPELVPAPLKIEPLSQDELKMMGLDVAGSCDANSMMFGNGPTTAPVSGTHPPSVDWTGNYPVNVMTAPETHNNSVNMDMACSVARAPAPNAGTLLVLRSQPDCHLTMAHHNQTGPIEDQFMQANNPTANADGWVCYNSLDGHPHSPSSSLPPPPPSSSSSSTSVSPSFDIPGLSALNCGDNFLLPESIATTPVTLDQALSTLQLAAAQLSAFELKVNIQ